MAPVLDEEGGGGITAVGTPTSSPSSQDFLGEPILEFAGEYRWLSNFHDFIIDVGGRMFASSEHAYQATKTFDSEEQREIQLARSPGQAKRLGLKVTLRDDWDTARIDMMRLVLAAKFPESDTTPLTPKLLATGDRILVEGNNWHDDFWGACWVPLWTTSENYGLPMWAERQHDDCTTDQLRGENHLGLLLMQRRDELRKATA
jgi:ribA/ribD-fused uncharacterized protein